MNNKYRILAVAAMCIVCLLVTLPQTQKEPYAPGITTLVRGPYVLDSPYYEMGACYEWEYPCYILEYWVCNLDGKPLVINGKNGLMYGEIRRHTEDGSPDYNEKQLYIYTSTGPEVTLEDGERYSILIDASNFPVGTYSCEFVTTVGGTRTTDTHTFEITPDKKAEISQMKTKEAIP